jgi:hypothetical protein
MNTITTTPTSCVESIRLTSDTIDAFQTIATDLSLSCLSREIDRYNRLFATNQATLEFQTDSLEPEMTLQTKLFELDPIPSPSSSTHDGLPIWNVYKNLPQP